MIFTARCIKELLNDVNEDIKDSYCTFKKVTLLKRFTYVLTLTAKGMSAQQC